MVARLSDRSSHRARVAAAYDAAAPDIARVGGPYVYRSLARPLAEAVVEATGGHEPGDVGLVLDVAAGSGALGSWFPDVVAVDLAAGQLRANPTHRRIRGDVELLPFRSDAARVAACAFGLNHLLQPALAVAEMARVAPVVAVSTWARPERPYPPKEALSAALERQVGRRRSAFGTAVDPLADRVGSVDAVSRLLRGAGLDAQVAAVEVEVPWPGIDAYLDYRLSMPSTPRVRDRRQVEDAVRRTVAALPCDALTWRPDVVVGVGTR